MIDRLKRFVARLLPRGGVLEQTAKSGVWNGAMNGLGAALDIVGLIVLASMLTPADFGLIGIALLLLSALRKFSELGLDTAIIQRKETNVDSYLNTALGLQLVRGLLLAGIMLALAPVIASVFNEPRSADVVRVLALSPLLIGFKNPGIIYFQKNLDFHKEFVYQLSGSGLRFVVSVTWALISPTVWALVFGLVASQFARVVLSYLLHGYRPWPDLDVEKVRELLGFGKWVTASSVLFFLYSEGDDVIVGWLLSATALGFYQTAYRLSNAPATEIAQVVSSVTFPAFSAIQDDVAALREGYYKTLQLTMFVSTPVAFGIAAVAPVFVRTLIGEAWLPAVAPIQILAIYGLLRSLGKTMGPVWNSLGRPDYITKLSAIRVFCVGVLIIPAVLEFGIVGAAAVVTGVYIFPMLPIDAYIIIRSIEGSYFRFAEELAYPVVAGGVMFLAVVGVDRADLLTGALELGLLVVVGAVVYGAAVLVLSTGLFNWKIRRNLRLVTRAVV